MAPELKVFVLAALPISEVRGSVPLGLYFGLSPIKTVLISILGSILPVFPILWGLNTLTQHLRKIKIFDRFFEWLFRRTHSKSKLIERLEEVGLAIFIAIPSPFTGVWTGCVAAYLFELPWIPTFIAAFVGTSIASLIVLGISLGIISFSHTLF